MFYFSYEERNRSLEVVFSRHKEATTYEEFTSRLYCPVPSLTNTTITSSTAAALIDSHKLKRSTTKSKSYSFIYDCYSNFFIN